MLESLFNKVAGIQACNFFKERLQHSSFHVKFAKFLRTPSVNSTVFRTCQTFTMEFFFGNYSRLLPVKYLGYYFGKKLFDRVANMPLRLHIFFFAFSSKDKLLEVWGFKLAFFRLC